MGDVGEVWMCNNIKNIVGVLYDICVICVCDDGNEEDIEEECVDIVIDGDMYDIKLCGEWDVVGVINEI